MLPAPMEDRLMGNRWIRALSAMTGSVIVALISVTALAAPLPTFTPVPTGAGNVLSGEPYQITACFNNVSATDPGYAPTIQVVVPAGSTLSSASYLGSAQTVQTIGTCAVVSGCPTGVSNPDTGLTVPLAQNETLAIVRYSLGSFSPTQPPACANLSFALGNSTVAPLELTRFVNLTPIFALGADPLDDPGTDPAVAGTPVSMPVTPKLLKLTKTIGAPEAETATGPNYPRTVNISVQVANGATITTADLGDVLPPTFQFIPGTVSFSGCAGAVTDLGTPTGAAPGGSLIRRCASVTGNGSPGTLVLSFQFFVPNLDASSVAIVTPSAPNKAIVNTATIAALFGATPVSDSGNATITAKLLATRKSVADVIDTGTTGPSPGDTIEYAVVVDLSDFWSVALTGANGLKVVDTLGDGQTFLGCADVNTTLSAQMNGASYPTQSIAANCVASAKDPVTGKMALTFDAGTAMSTLFGATWFGDLANDAVKQGASTLTLKFRANIDATYSANPFSGSGTPILSLGDSVGNAVVANGNASGLPVSDPSSTTVTIGNATFVKSIYAFNGIVPPPVGFLIGPGDTVTYRIIETIPIASFENASISDYLPLPFFVVGGFVPAGDTAIAFSGTPPPANHWTTGPLDNFTTLGTTINNVAPVASSNTVANSVVWNYGTFDGQQANKVIDLLFTFRATTTPFADSLAVSNVVLGLYNNSTGVISSTAAATNGTTRAPRLTLTKSITATSNPACAATAPPANYDAAVAGCDAGDTIDYRLTVSNAGRSNAYNVRLDDDGGVPAAGFGGSCTLLTVTNGAGAPVTTSGSLFNTSASGGLSIATIPADSNGTIDPTEVVRVNYRCTVQIGALPALSGPTPPADAIDNTARIKYYSADPAQTTDPLYNYASNQSSPGANVRKARASVANIKSITKVISASSVAGTTTPVINFGETLTYLITVNLAEGTYQNFGLTDNQTAIPSPITCGSNGFTCTGNVSGAGNTVTVAATAGSTQGAITYTYSAQRTASGTNTASISATNAPQQSASTSWTLGTPAPAVSKNFNPATADAGDVVQIRLGWNNGNAANPMFRCVITDNVNTTYFDPATIAAVTTPAGYTFGASTTTGVVTYTATNLTTPCPTVAANGAVFSVQLRATDTTGGTVANAAALAGTTLPSPQTGGVAVNASATANLALRAPTLNSKTITATSEPDTAFTGTSASVEIGELVTYRVTFTAPDGVTQQLRLVDEMQSGLANFGYVTGSAKLSRSTTGLSSTNNPGNINAAAAGAFVNVTPACVGSSPCPVNEIWIDLGDVTDADLAPATTETYTLELQLQALNVAANTGAAARTNRGRILYRPTAAAADVYVNGGAVTATVVVPIVQLTKTVLPALVAAGDQVTYTLTIRNNSSGAGAAPAYDWTFADTLPADLQAPALVLPLPSGVTAAFTGNGLNGTVTRLDPGTQVQIQYTATIVSTTPVGKTIVNAASARTTSLPGSNGTGGVTPGSAGTCNGERSGSGINVACGATSTSNNLSAATTSPFTTNSINVTKTLLSPQSFYAIGDVAQYQVQIAVPVGTATNVRLQDTLPAGLAFNVGSTTISSTAGITYTGTPTPPGVAGQTLTFTLGNVTATAAGTITIQYRATVSNVLANQDGTGLVNNARVLFNNPSGAGTITVTAPNPPTVRVGEPNLADTKQITAGGAGADAGDSIDFKVVVSNGGNTTAYQLDIRDVLPNGLFQISNVVIATTGGVMLNGTAIPVVTSMAHVKTTTNTNDTIDLADTGLGDASSTIAMAPGASLTLTFRAVVMNNVTPGQVLTNSIYTPYASQANCGTVGVVCRNASGGPAVDDDDNTVLNNYAESASAALTIRSNIAIDKQVVPTSAPIGATVLFTSRLSLIEGVTPSMIFTDVLPAGLTYVSHTIAVGHVGMTIANPTYNTRLGTGQTVSFNFGDIGNPANGSNADDFVEIDITARVDNIIANQDAVQLSNGQQAAGSLVTVTYGATPTTVTFDADPVTPGIQGRAVTVVEPVLKITKTVVPATQALGDVVTYSVTVAHDATSTADAFDVALTDALPVGVIYVPGSVNPPGAFGGIAGQVLSLNVGTLTQAAGSTTITYQARISSSAVVGAPLINNAVGVWGSIPGATGAPNNGRNGTTAPPALNDYRTSGSATLTPNAAAFIDAQKTVALVIDADTSGNLTPADTLEYTVTLRNTGSVVSNVVFTDPIPPNTTFVAGSTTTTRGTIVESPTLLTVNVGGMAANDVVTIRFRVTVNAGTPAGTVISNQGGVDSDQTVPEPTDADGIDANGDQPTDIVVGGPSPPATTLYAEKYVALQVDSDASGTVTQGDVLRYTIILHNTGAAPLTNVAFSDVIPAGLTYVPASATATAGTIGVAGANVTWSGIGTVAPAAVVSVTFDVTITSVTPPSQTYVNQGTATSTQSGNVRTDGNGNPSDGNQPTMITAVAGGGGATPLLDVQKRWSIAIDTPPTGVASPGDTLLYTVTIANNGAVAATNVHMTDPVQACTGALNPCTSFVAGSLVTSQGAIVTTSPIDVNLGTLGPGATATVSFRALVAPATADGVVIANQAAVTRAGSATPVPSDDNGNPADGLNPTLTPISTSAAGGVPSNLTKTIAGTSEPNAFSSGGTVLIGEVARFRMTIGIPPGTTRQVTMEDTLPAGMSYLPGSVRLSRVFDTGLVASTNPGGVNSSASGVPVTLTDGVGIIIGTGAPGTTTLAVFLGDVINSDNDANLEEYALEYRAVVQNVAANQAGTTLTNAATVSYWNALSQTQTLTPVSATLTIAEPVVTVNKSAVPAALLSTGGTTTYTLTIANAGGAAPAFDVVLTDALPAAFASVGARSITSTGATGIVDTTSGTTVGATIARIDAGGSVTVSFAATAPGPIATAPIANTTTATWTSLPGPNGSAADGAATPGAPGTPGGERTGSGGVNDYTASATATLQVGGTNITKGIVAARPRYAIGDTVTYQVDVAIPGSAFGALGSVVVTDVLAAGLTYVPASLAISYNGASSSTNPVDFMRTDNAPSPGLETLALALGTVSNSSASATTIRLTYQAIVDNLLSNQASTSLGNSASLSFSDPGAGGATATRGPSTTMTTVGEPFLALTKALTSPAAGLQAGSTASFSVVAGNTGTVTAFETVISDALPAGLFFPGGSVVTVAPNNVSGQLEIPTATTTAAGWQSSAFDLPVGDSVTFTFTATLASTVQPGQTLQNGVTGAYSSRNGSDPNERTGTSPGSNQSDDSQLNNYNASALGGAITVADPIAIDKTFSPNPAQNRYPIGQLVTYRLKVSLVEGTTNAVKATDVLPAGLTFVTSGAPGTPPGAPITFSYSGTPTVVGQQITFDLGNVVDLPNAVAADDFITIDVTARVDNVLANQDGTVLGNNASVSFTAPGGGIVMRNFDADTSTPGLQPLNLAVTEPVLVLTKSASPLSVSLGDEVTFTMLIDHTAASHADAYDVTIVDTLPAGLTYVPGSASIPPTVAGQTLTFSVGTLTLVTDNITITYRARVAGTAAVGVPLSNSAVLTYGSIPGATGAANSGRNGSGGINDYTGTANASVTPNANAQIRADKTVAMVVDADGSGNLTPGDTVEWTIVLANNGPAVTNVVFTDNVPTNTTYVAGSLATTKGTASVALPLLTVAVGPMTNNETITIRFRTTVNTNVNSGTVLSNQGSVDSDQTVPRPTDGDGNPGNGDQPVTIVVNGVPALAVTKAQSFPNDSNLDGQLNPGETIRYTLVVTSTGTSQAGNVVFTDPVPANTTVV